MVKDIELADIQVGDTVGMNKTILPDPGRIVLMPLIIRQ